MVFQRKPIIHKSFRPARLPNCTSISQTNITVTLVPRYDIVLCHILLIFRTTPNRAFYEYRVDIRQGRAAKDLCSTLIDVRNELRLSITCNYTLNKLSFVQKIASDYN